MTTDTQPHALTGLRLKSIANTKHHHKHNMITQTEYNDLKTRLEKFLAWLGNRTCYRTEELPDDCRISNEERAKIEIYEFMTNPPDRYLAYVSTTGVDAPRVKITTWMGDVLGEARLGKSYRSPAFGTPSKRSPVLKFKAINGCSYYGTYFESSGDYCRLKKCSPGQQHP